MVFWAFIVRLEFSVFCGVIRWEEPRCCYTNFGWNLTYNVFHLIRFLLFKGSLQRRKDGRKVLLRLILLPPTFEFYQLFWLYTTKHVVVVQLLLTTQTVCHFFIAGWSFYVPLLLIGLRSCLCCSQYSRKKGASTMYLCTLCSRLIAVNVVTTSTSNPCQKVK